MGKETTSKKVMRARVKRVSAPFHEIHDPFVNPTNHMEQFLALARVVNGHNPPSPRQKKAH